MERVRRHTPRRRSSELRDALGDHNGTKVEEYLEVLDLEVFDWEARCVLRLYSFDNL